MKKIIIAFLAISMPFFCNAQSTGLFGKSKIRSQKEISEYMTGAVPEVDGKVVFSSTIAAPGKSMQDLFKAISSWATLRYTANQSRGEWTDANYFANIEYAAVSQANKNTGSITCTGAEELVFSNKFLAKDYTQAYYTLELKASEGSVAFTMRNISYVYVGGSQQPERIAAEDWITDGASLNKKGELRKINGKFRVKTIDLKDELVKEITEVIK